MNIFTEIQKAEDNYNKPVTITDGLDFHLKEIVKKIIFYTNSKFLNHQENEGYNFFNIVNIGVDTFKKAVDFDTKNFFLFTEDLDYKIQALIESKELQKVFQDIKFAKTINTIVHKAGKYGGVVAKRSWDKKGDIQIEAVDFKNLVISQVDLFDSAIIEPKELTYLEIENKRGIWENVDEVLDLFEKHTEKNTVTVKEVEGQLPKYFINGEDKSRTLQHHIVVDDDDIGQFVMFSEEINESNYKMHKTGGDSEGRIIAVGQVEKGFEPQEAINRYKMYESDLVAAAGTLVFRTTDENLENMNVLHNLKSGDVIKTDDLTQVNTMSSVIPTAENLTHSWEDRYKQLSFTNSAYTGEQALSGTPFRSLAAQIQQTATNFDYEKELIGLFFGEIIQDWILPEIHKKINKKHLLQAGFTPDELSLINKEFSNFEANNYLVSELLDKEGGLTKNDYLAWQDSKGIENTNETFLDIPKDFFKNYKRKVKVISTGEQLEQQQKLQSLQQILETVGQNPQILQDKTMYGIFSKMLALQGLNPVSYGFLPPKSPQEMQADQEQQDILKGSGVGSKTGQMLQNISNDESLSEKGQLKEAESLITK